MLREDPLLMADKLGGRTQSVLGLAWCSRFRELLEWRRHMDCPANGYPEVYVRTGAASSPWGWIASSSIQMRGKCKGLFFAITHRVSGSATPYGVHR